MKRVRGTNSLPMDELMYIADYVKSKRLILQQSTTGGYIFDDYKDYRCDNWQVSMLSEHVFMVESGLTH